MITKMGQSNEHAFARYMMANRERVVPRQEIFEYLYPHSAYEDRRAYSRLGSLISRTNDWLTREHLDFMIICAKGYGYLLVPMSWLHRKAQQPGDWEASSAAGAVFNDPVVRETQAHYETGDQTNAA